MAQDPVLFALGASKAFGEKVAFAMGIGLAPHEEREFEWGEHKARPLCEVGRREVYVINSLQGDAGASANDKLVRLLFFIAALKDAGADRVTAVTPYLAYSRKDRRTKSRDPVESRYVAALFEAVGTDRIITLDVHNVSAFENAFRQTTAIHLPLARVFAQHLADHLAGQDLAVVSPDAGGNKRAELFRHELERVSGRPASKGIMEKHRSSGVVSGEMFAGDVAGRTAIIVDDLISSGGTIMRACHACRQAGATSVIAVAGHAMFGSGSVLFESGGPDAIFVSDTVPLATDLPQPGGTQVHIVDAAPLVADVLARLHSGEPVSELIPYD